MDEATRRQILIGATDELEEMAKHYFDDILTEKNYSDLAINFIFNCPAECGPKFSRKFKDYGLKNGPYYTRFKKRLLKRLSFKNKNYVSYENTSILCDNISQILKRVENVTSPCIFFHKSGLHFDSLFTHFRNAVAHGRIFKKIKGKTEYFLLYDAGGGKSKTSNNLELRAVMILNKRHINAIFDELKRFDQV